MTYAGVFVRQYLGQTPSETGQGTCSCPDVIICGNSLPPNPNSFATQADYGTAHPPNVALNNPNFVYVRGVPANNYTGGTNFFFYYVQSNLALWPLDWSLSHVTVGSAVPAGSAQNWAWAPPLTGGNSIYLTGEPLIWTPPNIDTGALHYCVICWADNSTEANPIPPDLASFGPLSSFDDLMYFLGQHPNMGCLNTVDYPTPPPTDTYMTSVTTQGPELINITVNFNNILDGTFLVNLSGDVSWTSGPTPLNVANYPNGFSTPGGVQFEANQTALLEVTWVQGTQPLGPNANISAQIEHVISPMAMDRLLDIADRRGAALPIQKKRMTLADGSLGDTEDVFILGQQTWNLNFT